jgi:hypothetical protein
MDGWMDGWVEVKVVLWIDCLQQSKIRINRVKRIENTNTGFYFD